MDVNVMPSALCGSVMAPPSKSAAHRAIIAAALAHGQSVIGNVDLSSDIRATIGACQSLGSTVDIQTEDRYCTLAIRGGMQICGSAKIHCGESGSTLRFFIPIACTLDGEKNFDGTGRLPQRPIDAYFPLFERDGIVYAKPDGSNLPLSISGRLAGGDYHIDGGVSSQYISGLLFALPLLKKDSAVIVDGVFESRGYVDLTVDILRQFGIDIDYDNRRYRVKADQRYTPRDYTVEGDYSQAAFFIVGGAIGGDVCIRGLNPDSLQPDSAIVSIMRRMGAAISWSSDGLAVKKSVLRGTEIDVSQCPDLVPPLAAAAAMASGETRITGAARLRIKESDRLRAMSENLRRLGIAVQEYPDGLCIRGGQVAGGDIDPYGDHRIAMALSIVALRARGGVCIKDARCVDKSYPGFFTDLSALGGKIS